MAQLNKYRVWCITEEAYVEGWYETEPDFCPHNNTHVIDPDATCIVEMTHRVEVDVANMATISDNTKEVQRVIRQPARSDHFMSDRDIRINAGVFDPAASFEDLKVDVATNKQVPWGEFSQLGVYKVDENGDYVPCTDQDDVDANAVMTRFQYLALDQSTMEPLNFDFMGGCLWSDNNLHAPTPEDKWKHRLYAIMAPEIPPQMKGRVRFFDGYMYPYEGKWQEAINCMAITVNPQPIEAAKTWFYLYYPKGSKNSHVLRIITFRLAETF